MDTFYSIFADMRSLFILLSLVCLSTHVSAQTLPSSFDVKIRAKDHVQGMAADTSAHCFYLSFTTSLVKCDYEGNILARLDSIPGHLGAMSFDASARKLYASLECKDDEIGRGIAAHLGMEAYSQEESRFYIAVFDVDRLEEGRSAMQTYEITEVKADYKTRYGCAGMDGVTIAPQIGKKKGKPCLYVAYGIYGDISRRDNDNQILLEYRLDQFKPGKTPKHREKYFIFTGNTTWGVQNLCYDANTGCIFMACYAGKKPEFPNFSLFAFPVDQKPVEKVLRGLENDGEHQSLELLQEGLLSSIKGLRGWRFSAASTGLCSLGDGRWFVSTPKKLRAKMQTATVRQLQWKGGPQENPFVEK